MNPYRTAPRRVEEPKKPGYWRLLYHIWFESHEWTYEIDSRRAQLVVQLLDRNAFSLAPASREGVKVYCKVCGRDFWDHVDHGGESDMALLQDVWDAMRAFDLRVADDLRRGIRPRPRPVGPRFVTE